MLGTITKTIGRSVTIHTYTAPPAGTEVTTQLVELNDQILVVDTQYAIPFAAEAPTTHAASESRSAGSTSPTRTPTTSSDPASSPHRSTPCSP